VSFNQKLCLGVIFLFTAASSRQLSLPGTWMQKIGPGT